MRGGGCVFGCSFFRLVVHIGYMGRFRLYRMAVSCVFPPFYIRSTVSMARVFSANSIADFVTAQRAR